MKLLLMEIQSALKQSKSPKKAALTKRQFSDAIALPAVSF
jgi:hypothetical protein